MELFKQREDPFFQGSPLLQRLDRSKKIISLSVIVQTTQIQANEIMAGMARISMTASATYMTAEHAAPRQSILLF